MKFSSVITRPQQLSLEDIWQGSDLKPERDHDRIGAGYMRVFELMKDTNWRSPQEIADMSKTRLDSGLRYLRYMKKRGHGYSKKLIRNGLYLYQIIPSFQESL